MKLKFVVLLGVVLILAACFSGGVLEVDELVPYINTTFGFRIEYPSNWQVLEDPSSIVGDQPDQLHAVAFLPDASAGTLFVVLIQDLDAPQTLDEFGAAQMDGVRRNADGAVYAALRTIDIGGIEALTTQTTVEEDGQRLMQQVVFVVNDMHGYGVTMSAPSDSPLKVVLDDMLASLGLLQ